VPVDDLALEPATDADKDLLFEIFASTREKELAPLPWKEEQKEAFLRMQFNAQHGQYHHRFASASFDIVKQRDRAVGRLYLDQSETEIRIIDIALLPGYRGQGIGGRLLQGVLEKGEREGLPVRIHVERDNRALGLYLRLGFKQIADKGIYCLLEKNPTG
jgi:ribosomal protein S18 acetylase RimI-like enzyme